MGIFEISLNDIDVCFRIVQEPVLIMVVVRVLTGGIQCTPCNER
jgi:hypothetical protein